MEEYIEEEEHQSTWLNPQRAIKFKKVGDCHICTSHKPGSSGYPRIRRNKKLLSLHRYIWSKYNGKIPDGFCIRHSCDNKMCINPNHLILGTIADNNKDARERGQHKYGEESVKSKLTTKDILYIRSNIFTEDKKLAEKFGVSPKYISKIKRGKVWKHLLPKDFKPIDRRKIHSEY